MSPASMWLQRLKYGAKWAAAQALYRSGLLRLWIRYGFRGCAAVLTYHRVLSGEAAEKSWSHPAIIVRRETFERHVVLLRKHFKLLSMADLEAHLLARRPFEAPSCLITFDDGWRDTYTEAWPVLEKHGAPAVVFLASGFIGSTDTFWQEGLAALLFEAWQRSRRDAAFGTKVRGLLSTWKLDVVLDLPERSVRETILEMMQQRKDTSPGGSEKPVAAMAALLGTTNTPAVDVFMTWDDARRMNAGGVTFGGHGVTHRRLTTLGPDEVEREILVSRETIGRELGIDVTPFCYPNGDWNQSIADTVSRAHFRTAFSTVRGFVRPDADRFAVCRINIHDDVTRSGPMFLARVAGLL